MTNTYHTPALLSESMDGLNIRSDGVYVDVTFGGGGHSKEILKRLGSKGRLYVFDQDIDATRNIIKDKRLVFIRSNFRYIKNYLRYYGVETVDGILADLGVSFYHFDELDRGFSFRGDSVLDMRMNNGALKTATHILNEYSEDDLAKLFYLYGELKNSRRIASAIVNARKDFVIDTTSKLVEIIKPFAPKMRENRVLAQAFQALRIEVNDELRALEEMLIGGSEMLGPGARFCIISYHSLEDRIVKHFFKSGNFEGEIVRDFYGNIETDFKIINRKVIVPTIEEQERNPRSRSAKLRIIEKKNI